jgi:hypothetical protein
MIPGMRRDVDDMRDFSDQDPDIPLTSTANLGSYARFLADLPYWSDMPQVDYTNYYQGI